MKLQRLLLENRGKGLFRVDNKAGTEATVYLYDYVTSDSYWGGVSAIDFAKALMAIDAETIHLRIDSPGGEIFAAQSMTQAIREHPANIIAHIDGVAASAASWIALAADEVVINPGAFIMIHQAQGMAYGNSADLRGTADLLDKLDAVLVAGYARETKQTAEQITDWMAAETWFNADEAVKYGFADRIADAGSASNSHSTWNLSAYDQPPKAATQSPAPAETAPAPAPVPSAEPAPVALANIEHLRRRLALTEKQAA